MGYAIKSAFFDKDNREVHLPNEILNSKYIQNTFFNRITTRDRLLYGEFNYEWHDKRIPVSEVVSTSCATNPSPRGNDGLPYFIRKPKQANYGFGYWEPEPTLPEEIKFPTDFTLMEDAWYNYITMSDIDAYDWDRTLVGGLTARDSIGEWFFKAVALLKQHGVTTIVAEFC